MSSPLHTTGEYSFKGKSGLPLRILMATSELAPFARAGGLGDMVAGLAAGLARLGIDVRVLMPRYGWIDTTPMYKIPDPVGCDYRQQEWWTAVYQASLPSEPRVRVYFLDRMDLYDRPGIYGRARAGFADNEVRFGVLSSATFALSRTLHWKPHIIHSHDWATAPAAMLTARKEYLSGFAEVKTVLTVHNLAHAGPQVPDRGRSATGGPAAGRPAAENAAEAAAATGGTPAGGPAAENAPEASAATGGANAGGPAAQTSETAPASGAPAAGPASGPSRGSSRSLSALESGLRDADRIVFVSPSFAEEALRPHGGFGFDHLLRERRESIRGILNGIDYTRWNPEEDSNLVENFDAETLDKKKVVRTALLSEFEIPGDHTRPLLGMVSRLDFQKGFDELVNPETGCLEALLRENRFYLVIVGTGDRGYEARLEQLAERYSNFSVAFRFDEALAHRVEAGSDFFLMPSKFEPCGLNQMYSLRYGTVPVVTATGGLKDTVLDISEDGAQGTGIVIPQCTATGVRKGIERALALWQRGPEVLQSVRKRGMQERFSIERMAERYAAVYQELLDEGHDEELGHTPLGDTPSGDTPLGQTPS